MKKYILIPIALFCFSCENFLEREPETIITEANFYETESDFQQAIIGAYAPLQEIYQEDWEMTELRSDNAYFIFDVANRGAQITEDLANFTVESNNETVLNKWQNNYLIVARANEIIATIDEADISSDVRNTVKGEALFLRALAYFDLIKNFGGVPLFLEPATSFDETFRNRVAFSEVLSQVITDAEEAATILPGASDQVIGRATSGAAYTLLADVHLSQGDWAAAESALENVINTDYSLLSDYADIFRPSNEGNEEIIFEVNYLEGTSQPLESTFPYSFLPELEDPAIITGVSPAARNAGGSFNTPTPDLLNAYEDTVTDQRFAATIATYTGPSPLVGVEYNNTPYVNKYQHPHSIPNQTGQNWIIYRYAEVLLMMAEAKMEQGATGEALTFINQVRQRAGLNDLGSVTRDDILQERRIELAFENKRWYDLVRTGQAVSTMNDFGSRVKQNPQQYYFPEGSAPVEAAFNVNEDYLVYPIPASEIIINPDLEQNPGYN